MIVLRGSNMRTSLPATLFAIQTQGWSREHLGGISSMPWVRSVAPFKTRRHETGAVATRFDLV
jgi:hypothetical protein